MIDKATAIELFSKSKCIGFIMYDNDNRILYRSSSTNENDAMQEFEEQLDTFKNYGTIKVKCADKKKAEGNYNGAMFWTIKLKEKAAPTPDGNLSGKPGSDFVHISVLNTNVDFQKKMAEFDLKMKEMELEKKYENKHKPGPYDQWIMPAMMGLFGDEMAIKMKAMQMIDTNPTQAIQLYGMINTEGAKKAAGLAGMPKDLFFKNDQDTSQAKHGEATKEETMKVLQLLNQLHNEIGSEKIIILLEGLNANPQLADMAITFLLKNQYNNGREKKKEKQKEKQ